MNVDIMKGMHIYVYFASHKYEVENGI